MGDRGPSRILVPIDFSDVSSWALEYAASIALLAESELLVMYADPFEPPLHFTAGQMPALVAELKRSKEIVTRELQEYARKHAPRAKLRGGVVEGTPATSILKAAESSNVDLIVMGTHGRTGMSRFMMGSVAERVLHETRVPLLTIRSKVSSAVRRIVCPVNFSEPAGAALREAKKYAELFGAKLVVLHVIEGAALNDDELQRRTDDWASAESGVPNLDSFVLRGDAAEQVIDFARGNNVDLIVLGAAHHRFSDTTVLGTTAVRVTRHSPVPVLTVMT